jgi:hypothetical protein
VLKSDTDSTARCTADQGATQSHCSTHSGDTPRCSTINPATGEVQGPDKGWCYAKKP